MGKAAHIYSASENGPRGRGGKNEAFIRSTSNGLWCCLNHADLIDKRQGNEFSAQTLFAWKALVEARARKLNDQTPSPHGWVDVIQFTAVPFKASMSLKIELSHFNLLHGPSESGKSLLLELAASITDSHHARRMLSRPKNLRDASNAPMWSGGVEYTTVDVLSKVVYLDINHEDLKRREGLTPCLLPPGDIEILLCSSKDTVQKQDEDDVEFFMRLLRLDKSALQALLGLAVGHLLPGRYRLVQGSEDTEDGTGIQPRCKVNGEPYTELEFFDSGHWRPLSVLGTSKTDKVILDLFIAKARETAKQRLTLLLIDGVSFNFDENNYRQLLSTIAAEQFQAILCLPPLQDRHLLEKVDGFEKLKKLEHLRPWNLIQMTCEDQQTITKSARLAR